MVKFTWIWVLAISLIVVLLMFLIFWINQLQIRIEVLEEKIK